MSRRCSKPLSYVPKIQLRRRFNYPFHVGVSIGAVEIPHAKAPAKQIIAVEFRLLKPDAGTIFDVTEAV